MKVKNIEKTKTTHIIRHFILFVGFISFVTSTINVSNVNSNLKKDIILEKLIIEDLNFLEDQYLFKKISYNLENQKLEKIENFNETFIYKFIEKVYLKVIDPNYKIISIKEINEILNIIVIKVSENQENNINNMFFNETILNLIGIYSNYKLNDFNHGNFNKNIIPIINKILNNRNNIFLYNSPKNKFLKNSIIKFKIFTENNNFFFNLEKNKELKKIFINIINEYINFLVKEKIDICNYIIVIENFLNFYGFEDIYKNDSYKKVYFEIIDCFLEYFSKNLNIKSFNTGNIIFIQIFLDRLFLSPFYLENITDSDTLTNTFDKIANFELNMAKNRVNRVSLYTIVFYFKYISKIPKEKNSKIIQIFIVNIENFLKLINNSENFINNESSFYVINRILYDSNINFEKGNLNCPELAKKIENTLKKYINKIVLLELKKHKYKVTELDDNYIIRTFLQSSDINLEKFISNEALKQIEQLPETPEMHELSEKHLFTILDKNLFINVFKHEFIDLDEIKNRDLVKKFLENYYNILKSANDIIDFEFYIVLGLYIKNSSEKLDIDINIKNNSYEKVDKLTFETELEEFIIKGNGVDFKKLFIVKFINMLKESDLNILYNFEVSDKENFKNFMINIIDNFRKLDKFFNTETNNNS